jgi:hypothetical protein
MTAFTPDIRIQYYPPNTDRLDPAITVTDWVDYSISASRGTSEYISAPYPASTVVTLLFDENVIPDIELGSFVEIGVYTASVDTWAIIHSGYVTSRNSSYRAYGLEGFLLEWQFSLTSGISIYQNMTWYNESNFTDTTEECIQKVYLDAGRFMWNQINVNTTWENYGPLAWDNVDDLVIYSLPVISGTGDESLQRLNAGYRNVWDDLVTLVYGVNGWIWEDPNGTLTVDCGLGFPPEQITITQDMLNTDIQGGDGVDKIRNKVTITEFDGVETTYYDDESISLYNERSGSLSTYLTETLEAANVAQRILNGLAYPLLSTEQISLNLLNPIFTDEQRDLLLYRPLGIKMQVEAPLPMGGTQYYQTIGCQFDITKDAFILGLSLAPYSQQYNSINWDQVPYSYTWTSYGTAFPTQKWNEL